MMKASRKKKTIAVENAFVCLLCKDAEPMEPSDFKKHREEVHGLTEHRGKRITIMHSDAADWFMWTYEWRDEKTDKPFAAQSVKQPRRGLDKTMWKNHE